MDEKYLEKLCKLIRYDILTSTTAAGSGHPTSSLSAVELLTTLFFSGFYHFDLKNPKNLGNDRFILSKGHASPLLYSLYHAAGVISYKELMTIRKFGSPLQGHPTPVFPYVDVATGSLGQGLSNGVGMVLGLRLKSKIQNPKSQINPNQQRPKVWVLLGDSEMAEGQVWEAAKIAAYYELNNLVGIIDVNRLGQQAETEEGWDIHNYEKKLHAFGWETIMVEDGHNIKQIFSALSRATESTENPPPGWKGKPKMIIARTVKGKGVSFLENKNGWHGKTLDKVQLKAALKELGKVDLKVGGKITKPNFQFSISNFQSNLNKRNQKISNVLEKLGKYNNTRLSSRIYHLGSNYATREAFGDALVELGRKYPNVVVLDAEVANSTYENKFQKIFPGRFFEMFIAEENMMGVAVGLSVIGYIPFVSTFAAFLTQTFDQVRMAQYSNSNLKIIGSHAGVSIGQDGPSQMGLEDIAMFRTILNSVIFYPSDAVSAEKLTEIMAKNPGIFYMRTTRAITPVIYNYEEEFRIGALKVHKVRKVSQVHKEKVLIISAGITLHEALKAQKDLANKNIETAVVDLYCVKPIDEKSICQLVKEYKNVIVVEDHYPAGGIGEAISDLIVNCKLKIENYKHLCVHKIPASGTPEELLHFEEIDKAAIIKSALSSLSA